MADGCYLRSGENVSGPYDRQSLLDMQRAGQIGDDDQISTDQNAWIYARDFFEDSSRNGLDQNADYTAKENEQVESGTPPIQSFSSEADGAPAGPTGARDRIVILGRHSAGKTIYLSTLYARLWRSLDGLTMSSLSGVAHRDAMRVVSLLEKGVWPDATLGNAQMAYELDYRGKKRLMVSLEYSGEVFRRAFVEDDQRGREEQQLLNHLDNAAVVLLLIDPRVAYEYHQNTDPLKGEIRSGTDALIDERYVAIDAAVDDDYGMVQAIKRVRNWPGGEDVPIVVVLTKMDQNHNLVKKEGGRVNFVKNHWPALARTLKKTAIFSVSAVQTRKDSNGKRIPSPASEPIHLEEPLKFSLKVMDKLDNLQEVQEMRKKEERSHIAMELHLAQEERRSRTFWITVCIGILLVGAFIIALIIVYR